MSKQKKDSQRGAIYAWERRMIELWHWCNDDLTMEQIVELVVRVWGDYRPGSRPPAVLDGRGRRNACGSRWEIKLPRWSRKTIFVLHETAHSLQQEMPWHGPEFAGLFLELLGHYAGIPKDEARRLAIHQKPRRVRFAVAADVPSRPTAEWRRWRESLTALEKQRSALLGSEPAKYGRGKGDSHD